MVEHRCFEAASPDSSRSRVNKRQLLLLKLHIGAYHKKLVQSGYCSRLTAERGSTKNEELAKVHDPSDPKSQGLANHLAFPVKTTISISIGHLPA